MSLVRTSTTETSKLLWKKLFLVSRTQCTKKCDHYHLHFCENNPATHWYLFFCHNGAPTKLWEGNVFGHVCYSVHQGMEGGAMWPLPVMHWTSPYRDLPSDKGTHCTGTLPSPPPDMYKLVHHKARAFCRADGSHPTGILSCYDHIYTSTVEFFTIKWHWCKYELMWTNVS